RYSRIGNSTFSPTVSDENKAPCWNRMPQRRSISWRCTSPASSRFTPKTLIRPSCLGNKPRIVRVSTDLPAPEAPTKPRISPRKTSSVTPLRTRLPFRSTTRSRTSMTGAFDSFAMSHPDRCKKHGKNAVEHDYQKNGFNDRIGGFFAERFGAALHLQTLDAGDDADDQRHERRLDHANLERCARNCLAQPCQEHFGLDAPVKPGHQSAAIQRRHRAKEGQDRYRN